MGAMEEQIFKKHGEYQDNYDRIMWGLAIYEALRQKYSSMFETTMMIQQVATCIEMNIDMAQLIDQGLIEPKCNEKGERYYRLVKQ